MSLCGGVDSVSILAWLGVSNWCTNFGRHSRPQSLRVDFINFACGTARSRCWRTTQWRPGSRSIWPRAPCHGIDGPDRSRSRDFDLDSSAGREALRHRVRRPTSEAGSGSTSTRPVEPQNSSRDAMASSSVSTMMASRRRPVPLPRSCPSASACRGRTAIASFSSCIG